MLAAATPITPMPFSYIVVMVGTEYMNFITCQAASLFWLAAADGVAVADTLLETSRPGALSGTGSSAVSQSSVDCELVVEDAGDSMSHR